ncbi:MAG: hypothetical protein ACE5EO_04455 [Candidatus Krumholzibacteriia bacterium]
MLFVDFFNQRVKRLGLVEVKMVQIAAACVALILVKLIPRILTVSIWWFVALAILCSIRPMWLVLRRQ